MLSAPPLHAATHTMPNKSVVTSATTCPCLQVYVATTHQALLLDVRLGFTQRWTHMLSAPPLHAATHARPSMSLGTSATTCPCLQVYVAITHQALLLEVRLGFTQPWSDMLAGPPLHAATLTTPNKSVVTSATTCPCLQVYVATTHQALLLDVRLGFTQRWTHMLSAPPLHAAT